MNGADGPIGLKPLPGLSARARRSPAAPPSAVPLHTTAAARGEAANSHGQTALNGTAPAAPVNTRNAQRADVAGRVLGMVNGTGGGMDPATLHAFMEQRRKQLAESPLAQQAMADPSMLAKVLQSTPAARAIMDGNPRLQQLLSSPDAMRGLLSGQAQQYGGVLGQDVEQHMDTVARLNSYSQRLRQERAGLGAAGFAQQQPHFQHTAAAASASTQTAQPSAVTPPADLLNGHVPRVTPPDAQAATVPQQPPADLPAKQRQRIEVSSEIQPAQPLPVSWVPSPEAAGGAAFTGTGSRWSADMPPSPRLNGHSHASHSWQQGPLPGQPAAKPAIPHADVLFPVVYCLAIGSLCQFAGRLLPFWLLLALLVPSFGFGVHYVVFVGGGIDPRRLPATRFTCAMLVTLEALSFAVFAVFVLPRLPHHRVQSILAICLGSLAFVQHYRAAVTDPGYLPIMTDPEVMASRSPRFNMGLCETCKTVRPLRSKHCNHCGRCVEGCDHHCPVINNCVGQGNARLFLAYCLALLPAQLLFLHLVAAFCRLAAQAPDAVFFPALWRASAWHPGIVLLAAVQVPAVALNTLLVVRALFCAVANLTTNELMRPSRFGYLADSRDESFLNPFDAGPIANCLQFWRSAQPPDWSSTYSDIMQAGPEAVAKQVPRFSVTAAVRSAQLANKELAESRARRRRRREDYILLQAGVRPETLAAACARDAGKPDATAASCASGACAHHQHDHGIGPGNQLGQLHPSVLLGGSLAAEA